MLQVVLVIVIFALMPLMMSRLKMSSGIALLSCSAMLHLFVLRSPAQLWGALADITQPASAGVIISVVLIGVLSKLMKHYKMLDSVVTSARVLVPSRRILLGAIPMMFGFLSVPGGAYMSAPFVDELGTEMKLRKVQMAVINLNFRHIAMFLSPFSTFNILMLAGVPGINVTHLIALNLPLALLMHWTGSILYLPGRDTSPDRPHTAKSRKRDHILPLVYGISPIALVIFLNTALKTPMYLAISGAILLIFAMTHRRDFLNVAKGGLRLDVVIILIGVYFTRNTILRIEEVQNIISGLFLNSPEVLRLLVIVAASIFLGFISGLYYISLGIFLPILTQTSFVSPVQLMPMVFFIGIWGFLGYYYSPLHLCQVMTLKHFDVRQSEAYSQHIRQFPWLALFSVTLYFLYKLVLLK